MKLLLVFAAYTAVAFVASQGLPGVKLEKGIGPAAGLAIVFGVLNLFLGLFIKFVLGVAATALTVLTLGAGFPVFFLIGTTANAIMLKLADSLLPGFDLDGWAPAFLMGFAFALCGWLLKILSIAG